MPFVFWPGFVFLGLVSKCLYIARAGVDSAILFFARGSLSTKATETRQAKPPMSSYPPLPISTPPASGPAALQSYDAFCPRMSPRSLASPRSPASFDLHPSPGPPVPEAAAPPTPPYPDPLPISPLVVSDVGAAQRSTAAAAVATAAAAASAAAEASAAGDRLRKLTEDEGVHLAASPPGQAAAGHLDSALQSAAHAATKRSGTPPSSEASSQQSPMSSSGTDYDTVRRFFEETSSAASVKSSRCVWTAHDL